MIIIDFAACSLPSVDQAIENKSYKLPFRRFSWPNSLFPFILAKTFDTITKKKYRELLQKEGVSDGTF